MRRLLTIILLVCSLSASPPPCLSTNNRFCGAWVATVANIDWPRPNTVGNAAQQETDLVNLIDSLSALGINALVFQVRPTADALYQSSLEPVSHWLTGHQTLGDRQQATGDWQQATGDRRQALDTFDPLAVALREAHKRQMEVHAWLNPFRVNSVSMTKDVLCPDHVFYRHPEWFWKYGEQYYFDPGLQETRDWICAVVKDIITHYEVDAIHMDDYFYPYPIAGQTLPDQQTFLTHARGFDNIEDWRRDNVNLTIEQISATIRSTRPQVQFGISPFGINATNYNSLYADILLWAEKGWIDYVIPQLYWSIDPNTPNTDYATLAAWWAKQLEPYKTVLYTGHAVYRMKSGKANNPWQLGDELIRQRLINKSLPKISGECYYSAKHIFNYPNVLLIQP